MARSLGSRVRRRAGCAAVHSRVTAERLLHALADGRTHSGEELARSFGITRAAIWKQAAKLADWGLTVEAAPGSGYRLPRRLDLLDTEALRAVLDPDVVARLAKLEVFTELGSTTGACWLRRRLSASSTSASRSIRPPAAAGAAGLGTCRSAAACACPSAGSLPVCRPSSRR